MITILNTQQFSIHNHLLIEYTANSITKIITITLCLAKTLIKPLILIGDQTYHNNSNCTNSTCSINMVVNYHNLKYKQLLLAQMMNLALCVKKSELMS